jgi:hypothetical protein
MRTMIRSHLRPSLKVKSLPPCHLQNLQEGAYTISLMSKPDEVFGRFTLTKMNDEPNVITDASVDRYPDGAANGLITHILLSKSWMGVNQQGHRICDCPSIKEDDIDYLIKTVQ